MKLPSWARLEVPSKEYRDWKAEQRKGVANFADFVFRTVEMVLVAGAVRFLEERAAAPPLTSTFLTALVAIYVHGKVSAALFHTVDAHDVGRLGKRAIYWSCSLAGVIAFAASNAVVNAVLPIVAANPP